jgi:hypothetical protein
MKIQNDQFKIALEIIKLVGPVLQNRLQEISLANYQLRLALSQHSVNVNLGNGQDLSKKIFNLRAILTHVNLEKILTIDLRSPDLPTITPIDGRSN